MRLLYPYIYIQNDQFGVNNIIYKSVLQYIQYQNIISSEMINNNQIEQQIVIALTSLVAANKATLQQLTDWNLDLLSLKQHPLTVKCRNNIQYMMAVTQMIINWAGLQVQANKKQIKIMLYNIIISAIKKCNSQPVINHCFEFFVFSVPLKQNLMEGMREMKCHRKIVEDLLFLKTKFQFKSVQQFLLSMFQKRQNLMATLNILLAFFKAFRYENDLQNPQFFQSCLQFVNIILSQNLQNSPPIVYLCCKIIEMAFGFSNLDNKLPNFCNYEGWADSSIKILQGKWQLQNVDQKYENKQSIESIYFRIKKHVTKTINFICRRLDHQKYTKIFFKKFTQDHRFDIILNQLIGQLEYVYYPNKCKLEQIKFFQIITRRLRNKVNKQNLKRIQNALVYYMSLNSKEAQKIMADPVKFQQQCRENMFSSNLKINAAKTWIQISFNKDKKNKQKNYNNQSFQALKNSIQSENMHQFQVALQIFSQFQRNILKSLGIQQKSIQLLIKNASKIIHANNPIVRASGFRALQNVIHQNSLKNVSTNDFLMISQYSYDSLTKDQSISVRINAGILLIRLSLKHKHRQFFKLVMFQCIVVLLKILQEVTIQTVGSLINQIISQSEYCEIILPLSKQIFLFCSNSFMQLSKKVFQQEQDQQFNTLITMNQCSQIIVKLLQNINGNDLLPHQAVQLKIFAVITIFQQQFLKQQSQVQYEVYQCLLKIIAVLLYKVEKLNQNNLSSFIKLVGRNYEKMIEGQLGMNLVPVLMNLLKHSYHRKAEFVEVLGIVKNSINHLHQQSIPQDQAVQNMFISYLITNIISDQNCKKMYPSQVNDISNYIFHNMVLKKFNQNLLASCQIKSLDKQIVSASFMFSVSVLCMFEHFVLKRIDKKKIKCESFVKLANCMFDKVKKRISYDIQMINSRFADLLKMTLLANFKLIDWVLTSPDIVMEGQFTDNKQEAAPGRQNMQKVKWQSVQKILCDTMYLLSNSLNGQKDKHIQTQYVNNQQSNIDEEGDQNWEDEDVEDQDHQYDDDGMESEGDYVQLSTLQQIIHKFTYNRLNKCNQFVQFAQLAQKHNFNLQPNLSSQTRTKLEQLLPKIMIKNQSQGAMEKQMGQLMGI